MNFLNETNHSIFIFFITFNLIAKSKLSSQLSPEFHKFQYGINISIDIFYRYLKNESNNPLYDELISTYNKFETAKLGYTTGVNFT